MKMRIIVSLFLLLVYSTQMASASGQKKLMSMRAAEEAARRALLESLTGLRIVSTGEVADVVAKSFTIDADIKATIKEVEFVDPVYDPVKDIARVRAEVDANVIRTITGKETDYQGQRFSRVGFGTSSPASAASLQALRAAELDAFRQLVEYFYGLEVTSSTKVRDYVLASDTLKTRFAAFIYGANMASEDPYGFADGTAYVRLTLTMPADGKDIFGEEAKYTDTFITVKGWGAERADSSGGFVPSSTTRVVTHSEVKEASIDVPVKTVATPAPKPPATPVSGFGPAE